LSKVKPDTSGLVPAIHAVVRKMLVTLNAIAREQKPWKLAAVSP